MIRAIKPAYDIIRDKDSLFRDKGQHQHLISESSELSQFCILGVSQDPT